MAKKIFIILVMSVLLSKEAYTQNSSNNLSYYYNKQLYNPASIFSYDSPIVSLLYHNQWAGVNDSPISNYILFSIPLTNKFILGSNVSYETNVLLNSFSGQILGAYKVPINSFQGIYFGLNFGIRSNNLDINADEIIDDPVIIASSGTKLFPEGQFGVNYYYKDLNIGISLTQLFKTYDFLYDQTDVTLNQQSFDPLQELFLNAEYNLNSLSEDFSFIPFVTYRTNKSKLIKDSWRSGIMAKYRNNISFGISYNSTGNLIGQTLVNINDKYGFRYAYNHPINERALPKPSHEIQLLFSFGNKNNNSHKQDLSSNHSSEQYLRDEDLTKINADKSTRNLDPPESNIAEVMEIERYKGANPDFFEIGSGNYISFGMFTKLKTAEKLSRQLSLQEIKNIIKYSSVLDKHIVILETDLKENAQLENLILVNQKKFADLNLQIIKVKD